MSFSSAFSFLNARRALYISMLSLGLFACKPSDAITQPDAVGSVNATENVQTFTPADFSIDGLTITEGKDYTKLANPQPVKDGKKEVVEFFWYGCGHCFKIEPAVQAWKTTLPEDVHLLRMPAQWNAPMQAHQRIAFTLQALGKEDELNMKVFKAIQEQGRRLDSDDKITEFMVQNGIDKAAWEKTYKGFDVNANIVTADTLFKTYQLDGVPAFIVNGKYVVKGDTAQTLRVISKLLAENK